MITAVKGNGTAVILITVYYILEPYQKHIQTKHIREHF